MANTQQQAGESGSVKELAILVGILLTVVAGAVGTYWKIHSRGVEAASVDAVKPAAEAKASRATVPAPAGVFHADVYFDFKSTRLRADAVRVLQDTTGFIDLANPWVVLVQGYADHQGPADYNKVLAQRRAEAVKQFLVDLGVHEASVRLVAIGPDGALCDEPTKECQQLNRRVHLEFRKLVAAAPAAMVGTNGGDQAQAEPTAPAGGR